MVPKQGCTYVLEGVTMHCVGCFGHVGIVDDGVVGSLTRTTSKGFR